MRQHDMLYEQQQYSHMEQPESKLYPEHEKMKPYISFVTVARNDDHGGNFLERMQVFISALLQQIKKHNLNAELIIVDWNPPGDRPKLSQVLSLSFSSELFKNIPCKIRIIEVPSEIHKRFQCSDKLMLFQMIGKNVGIRRAKGEYVIATNVDLLFSDDLMRTFVSKSLKPEFFYRIDRYDVNGIPNGDSVIEQLDYCEENLIRVNRKDGSFPILSSGGIFLFKCKTSFQNFQNYIISNIKYASSAIQSNFKEGCSTIQSSFRESRAMFSSYNKGVKELIHFYRNKKHHNYLLLMKFTKIFLEETVKGIYLVARQAGKGIYMVAKLAGNGIYLVAKLAVKGITSPITKMAVQLKKMTSSSYPKLHTNACGDFTLMTKEKWHNLRGYPEYEIFSFNIDSIILQMAYEDGLREKILKGSLRMYHMEHFAEDEIGMSYEEIDSILYCIFDKKLSLEETAKTIQIEKISVDKVYQLYKNSEHKRMLPKAFLR